MDPDQKYSPEYLAENRSQQLIQLAVAFAVLETLLIGLYFTSRYIGRTVNSIDVYFMLPAYIMSMCQIIATFVEVRHAGVGRHMITLSMKQVILLLKFVIFEEFTYPVAIALPKLSILFLYLRIFTARSFRYTTFAILGVVVITYLTSLTLNFTLCIPFAYNWNKSIPGGHCADSIAAYRYISVPNIATDLAMLILPFPAIWNLHASKMQKTGLTIIFLAGSVGTIAGVVRLVVFVTIDFAKDLSWYWVETHTWCIIEPGVYLIAACLLSLRPLFKNVFKDMDFGSIYTRVLSYIPRISKFGKTKDISLSTISGSKADSSANRGPRSGFIRLNEVDRKGNYGPEREDSVTGARNAEDDAYDVRETRGFDLERG